LSQTSFSGADSMVSKVSASAAPDMQASSAAPAHTQTINHPKLSSSWLRTMDYSE
jgi:hypothetical protein